MSMASPDSTPAPTVTETAGIAGTGPRPRHPVRGVLVAGAVVLAAAAAAVAIAGPFAGAASTKGVADDACPGHVLYEGNGDDGGGS